MGYRFANCFRNRKPPLRSASRLSKLSHITLCLLHNPGHHRHRFANLAITGRSLPRPTMICFAIRTSLAERTNERNHIYAVLKPKLQVFAIFLSECGYRQRDARQIDSLMLGQHSAVNHLALHVVTANARDTQLDQSVGYKNPRPGSHLACQTLESSRD